MANWVKKIEKAVGGDLQPGEQVRAGVVVQPVGTAKKAMARGVGGLAGAAIASRMGKGGEDAGEATSGIADEFPESQLVLGITSTRLAVWGHSTMSGKPTGLKLSIPLGDVLGIETEPGKVTHRVTIRFADGSAAVFEAGRVGNDVEEFAAAIPAR